MKKALVLLLSICLYTACNDTERDNLTETPGDESIDDKDGSEEEPAPPVRLGFLPDKAEGNVFELIEFKLYSDKSFTLADLREAYDSITWEIPALEGRTAIYRHSDNSSNFKFGWSHTFFSPGEYQAMLVSYKDGEIVHADTASVTITDKKDFLNFHWRDITEKSLTATGYHDIFSTGAGYSNTFDVKDGVPNVSLFIRRGGDDFYFTEREKEMLREPINAIYSRPEYDVEGDPGGLAEAYERMFINREPGFIPLGIWITPRTRIVLLECSSPEVSWFGYKVYAEPNI